MILFFVSMCNNKRRAVYCCVELLPKSSVITIKINGQRSTSSEETSARCVIAMSVNSGRVFDVLKAVDVLLVRKLWKNVEKKIS